MENEDKMKRTTFIGLIGVVIITFIAINIIATITSSRYQFDFTDDKRFTLSQGTLNILEKLNEPITLRFFFSNKLANGTPYLKSYAGRIKNFLNTYTAVSHGKITVQIIDPEPFSEEEDLAVSYGLKGVPIDTREGKAYFGLVATNSVDDVRTIPIFTFERERFTEYELSRIINDLEVKKKPVVGVISGLPIDEQSLLGLNIPNLMSSRAWIVVQQLKQVFTVKLLPKDATTIPDDVSVLMVVQPNKDTKDEIFKAIDMFILSGKPGLFFMDPHAESKGGSQATDNGFDARMEPLLTSWGVILPRDKVVTDRLAARKIEDETIHAQVDYIAWLNLKEGNLSRNDITTVGLKSINLGTSGYIASNDKTKTEIIPLITSNKRAMPMPVIEVRGKPDPARVLKAFQSEERSFVLAARIAGQVESPYQKGKEGNVNIVLVADTDLLRDEVWSTNQKYEGYQIVRPIADNASFVVNAVDHLTGSSDLISLRGRGTVIRPFTVVENIKHQSDERYLSERKDLQERLRQTEYRLSEIQKQAYQGVGDIATFRSQQQQEIKKFSSEMMKINKGLRTVQRKLYEKIDALGSWLKFINILLIPILVTMIGIIWYIRRNLRIR